MNIFFVLAVAVCAFLITDARKRHRYPLPFDVGKACVLGSLPPEKLSIFYECYNDTRSMERKKYKEGLKCVLRSYDGLVKGARVDLEVMRNAAENATEKIKMAFNICSRDRRTTLLNRAIKCLNIQLETDCRQSNTTAASS